MTQDNIKSLIDLARLGHEELFVAMIQTIEDVPQEALKEALFYACNTGSLKMVQALLDKGAPTDGVYGPTRDSILGLVVASQNYTDKLYQLLCETNAQLLTQKNGMKNNIAHIAAAHGRA